MNLWIKGIILGFVMVMPGMSGGTAFLIFGLYEDLIKDLMKRNIKPYLPLIGGIIAGIFISGMAFGFVFENYRDATVSFLLGCLLASIKSVLYGCPKMNGGFLGIAILGTMIGAVMVGEPLSFGGMEEEVSFLALFIGGALATAAMIIPGIPGSSVLILMGVYDVKFVSINELDIVNLLVFGAGAIMGTVLLLNILSQLYDRYKAKLSYFFAGLILGSSRSMVPSTLSVPIIMVFVIGFALVWFSSNRQGGELEAA